MGGREGVRKGEEGNPRKFGRAGMAGVAGGCATGLSFSRARQEIYFSLRYVISSEGHSTGSRKRYEGVTHCKRIYTYLFQFAGAHWWGVLSVHAGTLIIYLTTVHLH